MKEKKGNGIDMENIKLSDDRFTTFEIPKSNGKKRLIHSPNPKLMYITKSVAKAVDNEFKPHNSATGFRHKYDVIRNALIHRRSDYFFMFDIKNFFESITRETVSRKLNEQYALLSTFEFVNEKTKEKTFRLVQGSPSSPIISNIVMADFDRTICKRVNKLGFTYTRYADDITISCKKEDLIDENVIITLGVLRKYVAYALKRYIPFSKLELNDSKTRMEVLKPNLPVKVVGIFINKEEQAHKNNWLSTGKEYNEALVKSARDIARNILNSKVIAQPINTKRIESFLGKLNWFIQVNRKTKARTQKVLNAINVLFTKENTKKTKVFLQRFIK